MTRPVHRARLALALATALLAACGSDGVSVTELTATGAWARTSPEGATNGVVYVTIVSPEDDTLVGVSVPAEVAEAAELHETMAAGSGGHQHGGASGDSSETTAVPAGGMVMESLDEVELPAGEEVVLEPGGLHVMLVGLQDRLIAGERFTATLELGSGTTLPVEVLVADNPPD